MSTNPVNMPTIEFFVNGSTTPSTTIYSYTTNPLVPSGTNGIKQPPNWYYYSINNTDTATATISISITAATGYPLPYINFMLVGSGGSGGLGSAGGAGGGGGGGGVVLINNYYSGVSPTTHSVNLYPVGSTSNSVLTLDTKASNTAFYAYTGAAGGNATSTQSGTGGHGGTGLLVYPAINGGLISYCPIIRGGAGGNAGAPVSLIAPLVGASYNYAVAGGGLGVGFPAYVPVTFADGLTANIVAGGAGGVSTQSAGMPGPPSMFMLYFLLC